ncbi:MAG: hypothetical protein ACREQB_11830 [Candidatus Binataceae bacterium]
MRTIVSSASFAGGLYWILTHERSSEIWIAIALIGFGLVAEILRRDPA